MSRVIAAAYHGTDEAEDGLALARALAAITDDDLELVRIELEPVDRGSPGVTTVVDRSVAHALRALSGRRDVGTVVLGSTHHGPLGRLLLGMGAEYVVPHAGCPVAIAPPGHRDAAAGFDPPVVGVAYDGTRAARSALAYGAALARAGGLTLRIVTVAGRRVPGPGSLEAVRAATETANPGLTVELTLLRGRAARALVDASADVGLLVAGAHDHRAVRRVLLGTVATALVRGARCPLVVVP